MSPALAGRFLTTGPPGKPLIWKFSVVILFFDVYETISTVHNCRSAFKENFQRCQIIKERFFLKCFAAAAAKSLQSCPTLCDPIDGSHPWDSPGKNTGVGCHFLFQCMKVKSESEVAQSCPTLSDSMDCSLPGSSIHGIFQARVLEWGAIAFSVYIS